MTQSRFTFELSERKNSNEILVRAFSKLLSFKPMHLRSLFGARIIIIINLCTGIQLTQFADGATDEPCRQSKCRAAFPAPKVSYVSKIVMGVEDKVNLV
ncbi:hypothetical protein RvY_17046-2 [Ramazzottius varieornatus]|uniref:Uncharacterized protein n=1 Tax=Ramazzottius varieornatus TaxID=947166 RepID=A0A1D1W186_RAMVA|nr:hypothetical protein RvY_17046-2 [Ramazzottius varieornatus]